ncbi:MAG: formate dehydrogenase subunit gamma [Pseudomonadota bacterium]|nr:formate dehydrogenase subunit gamma [Pseudomonadota bacterium]
MTMTTTRSSYGPLMLKGMLATVLLVLILPLVPYVFAVNTDASSPAAASVPNPGADLWRAVRQRDSITAGISQVKGVETGVLINPSGKAWLEFRKEKLIPYSAYVFAGIASALLLYFLLHGRIRIKEGRSGVLVPRYSRYERWVHWIMVVVFMALALTGVILLYGRFVLIPLLGPEGFHVTAQLSKWLHDIMGPIFIISLLFMAFSFFREALFNFKVDGNWLLHAGGYLGGKHPSSGKINAGQKGWYWAVVFGGLALIGSGLVMYFPNFQQGREIMQDANMIHGLAAVFVIAFMFIHIYLASVGMEGSLECMTSGNCDENWAEEQHDLWYEEMKEEGRIGIPSNREQ